MNATTDGDRTCTFPGCEQPGAYRCAHCGHLACEAHVGVIGLGVPVCDACRFPRKEDGDA